jgi:ribokinase
MAILNFGSLNTDDVYRVVHIARPGETIASGSFENFPGGRGLNQSIALARAGAKVRHVGQLGADGLWLKELLAEAGVEISGIRSSAQPTGRAIIQVEDSGQNSIVLFPGAASSIPLRSELAGWKPA